MWVADDYKLVREWVARCGGVDKEAVTRDVTRDQHASTLQFFEDYDGKCSLMAGLLARYSIYLLYWYKSTNTDAARRITDSRISTRTRSIAPQRLLRRR